MSNYQKPSWFIDLSLRTATGEYSPQGFVQRAVLKPSGTYNPGSFNPLHTLVNLPAVVHGRDGSYVQGGFDPSQNTHVKPSGKYNPGSVEGWTWDDVHKQRRGVARGYTKGGYKATPEVKAYKDGAKIADLPDPDPHGAYYFELSITDDSGKPHTVAHFQECSGLKNSCQVFEFNEGGLNHRSHKLPGQSKYENLVLKYCTSASTFMMEWRDRWMRGEFGVRTKYSGHVKLMNNFGMSVRVYEFTNAWPVSWEGPTLNSGGSDLAIETIELAHDGLVISEAKNPS